MRLPSLQAGETGSTRGPAVAASVVAVEGVALIALTSIYAGFVAFGHPHNRGLALFGATLGLLAGLCLLAGARGIAHRRRAAYTPVLLIQLLAVPVGIGLVQGHRPLIAAAVLAPALVTLFVLLGTPAGRAIHAPPEE